MTSNTAYYYLPLLLRPVPQSCTPHPDLNKTLLCFMSPNNKINSETSQGRLHVYINLNKLCNLILFLFNCADFYFRNAKGHKRFYRYNQWETERYLLLVRHILFSSISVWVFESVNSGAIYSYAPLGPVSVTVCYKYQQNHK